MNDDGWIYAVIAAVALFSGIIVVIVVHKRRRRLPPLSIRGGVALNMIDLTRPSHSIIILPEMTGAQLKSALLERGINRENATLSVKGIVIRDEDIMKDMNISHYMGPRLEKDGETYITLVAANLIQGVIVKRRV